MMFCLLLDIMLNNDMGIPRELHVSAMLGYEGKCLGRFSILPILYYNNVWKKITGFWDPSLLILPML